MDELDILIDEYLAQGLSLEKLKETIRREIAKNKLSSDVKGYIMSYVSPEIPQSIESMDDISSYTEDPKEQKRLARELLILEPSVSNIKDAMDYAYIPYYDILDMILEEKIRPRIAAISYFWYYLVYFDRFFDAEKIMKMYPGINLDKIISDEIKPYISDITPDEVISYISRYSYIMSKKSWKSLGKISQYWSNNSQYQYLMDRLDSGELLPKRLPLIGESATVVETTTHSRSRSPIRGYNIYGSRSTSPVRRRSSSPNARSRSPSPSRYSTSEEDIEEFAI